MASDQCVSVGTEWLMKYWMGPEVFGGVGVMVYSSWLCAGVLLWVVCWCGTEWLMKYWMGPEVFGGVSVMVCSSGLCVGVV